MTWRRLRATRRRPEALGGAESTRVGPGFPARAKYYVAAGERARRKGWRRGEIAARARRIRPCMGTKAARDAIPLPGDAPLRREAASAGTDAPPRPPVRSDLVLLNSSPVSAQLVLLPTSKPQRVSPLANSPPPSTLPGGHLPQAEPQPPRPTPEAEGMSSPALLCSLELLCSVSLLLSSPLFLKSEV